MRDSSTDLGSRNLAAQRDILSPQRVEQILEIIRRSLIRPKSVSTDTTLEATDTITLVDATAAAVNIVLPRAAHHNSRIYHVKKLDAVNNITISCQGSETIDGSATLILNNQYESAMLVSNGTNWFII